MKVSEDHPSVDEKSAVQFCTTIFSFVSSFQRGLWLSMYMNTLLTKSKKERAEIQIEQQQEFGLPMGWSLTKLPLTVES